MKRERPIALVDTNVWLDNCLGDRPGSRDSRKFLMQALNDELLLVYPVHCLRDIFYLVQVHLKALARKDGVISDSEGLAIREAAWACVDEVRRMATAIAADESDAWRACKYRAITNDLEDNFVLAAAERASVDFIVTNDIDLVKKSTVNAYTPADATRMLEATRS